MYNIKLTLIISVEMCSPVAWSLVTLATIAQNGHFSQPL